jgi:hypothetical protein
VLFALGPGKPDLAVREFYSHVVAAKPIGIPSGEVRSQLWPLMSPRLVRVLENAAACERDYFRRLKCKDCKPEFWWLEMGLFSGGDEKAMPAEAKVLQTRAITQNTFRVGVEFTYRETFETYGRPPDPNSHFSWRGVVTVDCSTGACLIDDYAQVDASSDNPRRALSESFFGCKGTRWVGERR